MGFSLDGSTVELRAKSNDVADHRPLIHATRHIFKYTCQYTSPFIVKILAVSLLCDSKACRVVHHDP